MRTYHPLYFEARFTLRFLSSALLAWIGFAATAILIDMVQRAMLPPSVSGSTAQLAGTLIFALVVTATTWFSLSRQHATVAYAAHRHGFDLGGDDTRLRVCVTSAYV